MRYPLLLIVSILLAVALVSVVSGQEPARLSARDTLRINSVGSPTISPQGDWVLYTRSERDMEDEELERSTQIFRVRADGSERRQMTRGNKSATSPAWLPDGERLAFLSARGEGKKAAKDAADDGDNAGPKQQVYFMPVDGGEAWAVTDHDEGVSAFRISLDGNKIAYLASDAVDKEEKERKKLKDDTIVVGEQFRWTHLWVWDIEAREGKRLTKGDFTVSDPRWSPDSSALAYVTRPTTENDDSWNSDVWVVDLEGSPRQLHQNAGTDTSPRWSWDGSRIAFASKPQIKTNTWYSKLMVVPTEGGEPSTYLDDFDRDLGAPMWSHDGRSIYWSTGDKTSSSLFEIELSTADVKQHQLPPGRSFGFELSRNGRRWVWAQTDPTWPAEIVTAGSDFRKPTRLSDANSWLREEDFALGQVKVVSWPNSDGQEIEGVLTLPVDYREGDSYPFILNPHGGPSGAVQQSWSSTNQFFAANGFVVLQPNFRGSSNYGQEFLNANRNYWGIRDYDDCMTGVDFAIERGWADPERLIAYGWSYGGYMSFWISTQTDRFKVVSPGAGLSNLYSMYSTTDISNYLGWFFGTPWDNEEIYRKLSPIRHAKNVSSKILIMTGAEDKRVPPEQSIEFYRALKDLDKEASLVIFPREGHGISEPRHQIDRLRRYLFAFSEGVGIEPHTETMEDKQPENTTEP